MTVMHLPALAQRREIQRIEAEYNRRRREIDESFRKARENQTLLFQGQYASLDEWHRQEKARLK